MIKEEFAEVDTDDLLLNLEESIEKVLETLEEKLKNIKSNRASNDVFDELPVKAYGEIQRFGALTQTIVRGQQLLTVKVYDDSVKEEVMKSL